MTISSNDVTYLMPMDQSEARQIVDEIRRKTDEMGYLLLELRDRRGWQALGYTSWTACLNQEFDKSRQHLYRLMWTSEINEELSHMSYRLNIRQAEALHGYLPETRHAVISQVIEREVVPTATVLRSMAQAIEPREVKPLSKAASIPVVAAVELDRRKVELTNCQPIIDMMHRKQLTPAQALHLWDTYQECKPVMTDLLKYGVTNETVIRRLFERRHTEGYREIIASGCVQMVDDSIDINRATPEQIRMYFDERSKEHQQRAMVERDTRHGVEAVQLTLYLNDTSRSASILMRMLGERNAREIARQVLSSTGIASHAAVYAAF